MIHLKMCVGIVFQNIFQCFRLVFVVFLFTTRRPKPKAKAMLRLSKLVETVVQLAEDIGGGTGPCKLALKIVNYIIQLYTYCKKEGHCLLGKYVFKRPTTRPQVLTQKQVSLFASVCLVFCIIFFPDLV